MKLLATVATFILTIAPASAPADILGTFGPITIEARHAPTGGLSGLSTWMVSASSTLPLQTFDFITGDTISEFGFLGPINQLHPAGNKTAFIYDWAFVDFCFCDPAHDSNLGVVGAGAVTLITPSLNRIDSANQLSAAFSLNSPQAGKFEFARVVVADFPANVVRFRGSIGFGPSAGSDPVTVFGQIGAIPEPSCTALIVTTILCASATRRRHCRRLSDEF